MSRKIKMDTDGSIMCINKRSSERCDTDLRDLIDFYSEEAKGVVEKAQGGWATDNPEKSEYYGFEEISNANGIIEKIKSCIKCCKNFKNVEELQSHRCSANHTDNSMKVYFINLADSPEFVDENEACNELSVPGDISIKSQYNTKNPKYVKAKDLKTVHLESDIPIIIDDDDDKVINTKSRSTDLNIKTLENNVPSKVINIENQHNTILSDDVIDSETNVSIVNPDVFLNSSVILLDDDSITNFETVSRNVDDENSLIDDTSILKGKDKNAFEFPDELINSNNNEDSLLINPPPNINNIVKENSALVTNFRRKFDHVGLSKVLETVSADLNTMIGSDDLVINNLHTQPLFNVEKKEVTNLNTDKGVLVDNVDVKLLSYKKENIMNASKVKNIQELNELPYLDTGTVNSSIYLENGVQIEELDIIKDTENNMEGVDPKVVLENGIKIGDSNAPLENVSNDFVLNIFENYVAVFNSKVLRVDDPKKVSENVMDLETVITEDSMDVVELDDINQSSEIEKALEDVDPEAIFENGDFDPKVLENCMEVLDSNVMIHDRENVTDPKENPVNDLNVLDMNSIKEISNRMQADVPNVISENSFNVLDPKIAKRRSSSMEVDDPNINIANTFLSERCLDNINPNVAGESNINSVDLNNIEIEYFTKDFEDNMQAMDSKMSDNGIQMVLSSLNEDSMQFAFSNQSVKTNKQSINEIINTEKLISVNNVPALTLNILTDNDLTSAKPDLLSDPCPLYDLGKFVLEGVVHKRRTKKKSTKSKFTGKKTKTRSTIKPIIMDREEEINHNSRSKIRDEDESIFTDSMMDLITSNQDENTMKTENIKEFLSTLEKSIARERHCRSISTSTSDDEDVEPEKRISFEELVMIPMPPDGQNRSRKFRNKKTQTYFRRVKPPQYEGEMREVELLEQVQLPAERFENSIYKKNYKHVCTVCNNRFDRISRLHLHMLRHEQVVKLPCHLCNSKFVVQCDLDRHLKIMHLQNRTNYHFRVPDLNDYPHKCEYCKLVFSTVSSLLEHLKKLHPNTMYLIKAKKPAGSDIFKKKFQSYIVEQKAHNPSRIVVMGHHEPNAANPVITYDPNQTNVTLLI